MQQKMLKTRQYILVTLVCSSNTRFSRQQLWLMKFLMCFLTSKVSTVQLKGVFQGKLGNESCPAYQRTTIVVYRSTVTTKVEQQHWLFHIHVRKTPQNTSTSQAIEFTLLKHKISISYYNSDHVISMKLNVETRHQRSSISYLVHNL